MFPLITFKYWELNDLLASELLKQSLRPMLLIVVPQCDTT